MLDVLEALVQRGWWTKMRANASCYQQAGYLDLDSSEASFLSAFALPTGSQDLLRPVRPCLLAPPEFFTVIDMTGFHRL